MFKLAMHGVQLLNGTLAHQDNSTLPALFTTERSARAWVDDTFDGATSGEEAVANVVNVEVTIKVTV